MINCIMFHGKTRIELTPEDIDVERVLREVGEATSEGDDVPWWYLQGAVAPLANGGIKIDFTCGHSRLPSRSFGATLLWLQERSRRPWSFEIVTSDEYDGFTVQERCRVTVDPTQPYECHYDDQMNLVEQGNQPWHHAILIKKSVPA